MKRIVCVCMFMALCTALTGCGFTGMPENGVNATDNPTVSASPAVVTPDTGDGIVRDNDGVITDDDTGTGMPRTDAGRTGAGTGNGMNGNTSGTNGSTGTNGTAGTNGTTGTNGAGGAAGRTGGSNGSATMPANNG